MTAINENTPTSSTVLSNSTGYCNKFIAWCRKNPKKTAVFFIIVIAIVFVWIHGPFSKINIMPESIPAILGDNGSGVN